MPYRPRHVPAQQKTTPVVLRLCALVSLAAILLAQSASAQDLTRLGGALSTDLQDRNAIQAAAPNVASAERRQLQADGFPLFHRMTTGEEGLGPRFINRSCAGCHINNGKGLPKFTRSSQPGSQAVVKVKARGLNSDGSPPEFPGLGHQILDHDLNGDQSKRVTIRWIPVAGQYPDGNTYTLRRPRLSFSAGIKRFGRFTHSLRIAPPMIGLGLLEAIPARTILRMSDPTDRDGDGISGRVNFVVDKRFSGYALGRFGFKASQPNVKQQSAAALYKDMEIANSFFSDEGEAPEITDEELNLITLYQRIAGVPKARDQDTPAVLSGKALFKQVGCDDCHRMTLTTGSHEDPELRNQVIHPFTDLLLHDMGPGLADKFAEFSARGAEWRTTPLWGLGFAERLARRVFYLHDGRARTIEEAILWHGGEAEKAQQKFKELPKEKRDDLITFLRSL